MFNLHLLQKELTVDEYEKIIPSLRYNAEWQRLPAYMIAHCPFCSSQNIENLDTYTPRIWRGFIVPTSKSVFYHELVVRHCDHFALAQFFFLFYGDIPDQLKLTGIGTRTTPYVIGHLLENGRCLAVMHTLPVCEIEDNSFVPRYTLLIISYFSEQPKEAIQEVERFNMNWYNLGESTLYLPLQFGGKYWADLSHWVAKGQLYWVDGNDPELNIRTHDVTAFPYGHLTD